MKGFAECRRNIGRRFPTLRKIWSLVWGMGNDVMWYLRNIFTGNRPVEVDTENGAVYMVPEGHIARLMWEGWFEKDERDFVDNYLKPGMNVINIGANAGLYTLIAAKIVGPDGEVHAFEPASTSFDRLKRNVTLNDLKNIHLNQLAMSDFKGALAVRPDPANPNLDSHYFVERLEGKEQPADAIEIIPCDTLDNYFHHTSYKRRLEKVDMIIIDVEGVEMSVFNGAQALLAASPNLVIMAECTERLDEIDWLLRSHGFSFYIWNAAAACLEETTMKRGTIYAMRKH